LLCKRPKVPVNPKFGPTKDLVDRVGPHKARLILAGRQRWANGTTLNYAFLPKPKGIPKSLWNDTADQKAIVSRAFQVWSNLVNIKFVQTSNIKTAQIKIGWLGNDGAWSFVGRDILTAYTQDKYQRTMNFGWTLESFPARKAADGKTPTPDDTALHEIGHTLGWEHEHQNPNAGIEWNEEAVIEDLSGPPNNWDVDMIHHNILDKVTLDDQKDASQWDKDSVMEYPFKRGLIKVPATYQTHDLTPAGGLSKQDVKFAQSWYPRADAKATPLRAGEMFPIDATDNQQQDVVFTPDKDGVYAVQTLGAGSTVMVLRQGDEQLDADDDSGELRNSRIVYHLKGGEDYHVSVRVYQKASESCYLTAYYLGQETPAAFVKKSSAPAVPAAAVDAKMAPAAVDAEDGAEEEDASPPKGKKKKGASKAKKATKKRKTGPGK